MSLRQSISTVFRKYAEFQGFAGRPEYWWWVLFTTLVSFAATTIGGLFSQSDVNVLSSLWALAIVIPTLAVSVRRLRDAGYHWAFLFLALIPLIGAVILIVMMSQPGVIAAQTPNTRPQY